MSFSIIETEILNEFKIVAQKLLLGIRRLVPISEAADILGITSVAVRYHIKAKSLEGVPVDVGLTRLNSHRKPKTVLYVTEDSLDEFKRKREKAKREKPGPKSKES